MYRYFKIIAGVTFITGNLKDCLTKQLILLKYLIVVSLQN